MLARKGSREGEDERNALVIRLTHAPSSHRTLPSNPSSSLSTSHPRPAEGHRHSWDTSPRAPGKEMRGADEGADKGWGGHGAG
jgi:hypothetical protein